MLWLPLQKGVTHLGEQLSLDGFFSIPTGALPMILVCCVLSPRQKIRSRKKQV
jgi:hypothetical protein